MNTKVSPALRQQIGQKLRRWSGIPAVEWTGKCVLTLLTGFVLAGVRVGGTLLPLPICLAAALGLSVESFAAYAGGCLGYAALWGIDRGLEPMAAGLLIEAGYCIFGDQSTRDNRWLAAGSCMVFTALVGFFYLLEQRFAPAAVCRWLLRVAAAGGGTFCMQLAVLEEHTGARLVLLALLSGGLCALDPVGFPLGLAAACTLAAAALRTHQAVTVAVLCGLSLELCWGQAPATAILALGALVCRSERRLLRLGLWLGVVLTGVLVTGGSSLLLAGAILGAGLSILVPREPLFLPMQEQRTVDGQRLQAAATLLDQLRQCLESARRPGPDPEISAVFDRAADRICRMCSLYESCWQENAQDTCEALSRATPAMVSRGRALRGDLPPLFVNRCRHLDGFLQAVNRELDDLSCRRQARSRIRESRRVLVQQYGVLSQALLRDAPALDPVCRFRPEVGFRSRGRRGNNLSGDCGASFRMGSRFYLLLCDGMGTGASAAAEAGAAIAILRTLLQAGTEPDQALELLNGIYILRDDGGFATVDLLWADLETGEGVLLKWGSPSSFLKTREELQRIGTASPPPGLGVGEGHRPEEVRLSLGDGEMAVLVSDGVGGEDAERFMRQYGGQSPKELASGIIACSQSQEEEDDRTAAVLLLRPSIVV